jgi:hypothetical protein
MPYLNDELREWIALQLGGLGVDEIAIYAVEAGDDEQRRVLVATEVGLLDGWYGPRGSTARYSLRARLYPWQAVRDVELRVETYRVWALEHRTRWHLRMRRPAFESATEAPDLGNALADFAKVSAVMAEPSGWSSSDDEPAESPPGQAAAPQAGPAAPVPAEARRPERPRVLRPTDDA